VNVAENLTQLSEKGTSSAGPAALRWLAIRLLPEQVEGSL
jgi:hypothetical protein